MLSHMTITKQKRPLFESGSIADGPAREDGAWKVRIISEGKGSSGVYTRELLESYHSAFNDVLSFNNHPGMWDGPESRDFTMIAGEILGETWLEDDERGMASVAAWFLPNQEHRANLEQYRKKLGLSIYINGEGYVREDGEFEVTWFDEHDPYASVDVVIAAGRGGKLSIESMRRDAYARRAKEASADPAAVSNEEEGLSPMAEKDVLDAVRTLTAVVEAKNESSKTEVQATVNAEAVSAAVQAGIAAYAAATSAIGEANLLPSQEAELRKRAATGEDITQAIESAKVIATEAREAAGASAEPQGQRVTESGQFSGSDTATEHKFTGFSGGK